MYAPVYTLRYIGIPTVDTLHIYTYWICSMKANEWNRYLIFWLPNKR